MMSEFSDKKKAGDKKKSIILARAVGWLWLDEIKLSRVVNGKPAGTALCVMREYPGQSAPWGLREDLYTNSEFTAWERVVEDLYDPQNMALAWRVLNWAIWPEDVSPRVDDHGTIKSYTEHWWFHPQPGQLSPCYLPPSEAQRAWLNNIYELVIEAELVEKAAKIGTDK